MESAVTRIEPPELESAATHSQSQGGISLNLYPAVSAATRIQPPELESAVTCIQPPELETAATCIQPPEFELAAGQNQLQLVFNRVSEIDISVGISDFNKYNYVNYFEFDNFQIGTVNFS